MKKLIALLLAVALTVCCLTALAEGSGDMIPAEEIDLTANGSAADIDIRANTCAGEERTEAVLYYTLSWEVDNAVYYRSLNYMWDPETLSYSRYEDPDWTCGRDYAEIRLTVENRSNVPLSVEEHWRDDDDTEWFTEDPVFTYRVGGETQDQPVDGPVTVPSAAAGFDGAGTVGAALLTVRLEMPHSVGDTVDADELDGERGVLLLGDVAFVITGITENTDAAESEIRDTDM